MRAITFTVILALAGCAGSPARIGLMSQEALQKESSFNLCNAYAFNQSEKVKAELLRRNKIPAEEWALIEAKQIRIGMSELGLICSWGRPGIYGSINKTATRYGASIQWVYRSCDYCSAEYVYTSQGKVTAWQD